MTSYPVGNCKRFVSTVPTFGLPFLSDRLLADGNQR
jgi:hypothetical protein